MSVQKATRTAAALTSTLLVHHIAVKLEIILDKEADITHQAFADQIEARLGSGEGDNAKGPDTKVWNKGRNLGDVRPVCDGISLLLIIATGRLAVGRVLLFTHNTVTLDDSWIRSEIHGRIDVRSNRPQRCTACRGWNAV